MPFLFSFNIRQRLCRDRLARCSGAVCVPRNVTRSSSASAARSSNLESSGAYRVIKLVRKTLSISVCPRRTASGGARLRLLPGPVQNGASMLYESVLFARRRLQRRFTRLSFAMLLFSRCRALPLSLFFPIPFPYARAKSISSKN